MFKIIPLLSDQCAPQLHCLPSGSAPDAACSFTGKKRVNRRRGREHEPALRGRAERDRHISNLWGNSRGLVIILKVISAAEKPVCSNEINIRAFDGSIENTGLSDAYHRDYSASYTSMQIKIFNSRIMWDNVHLKTSLLNFQRIKTKLCTIANACRSCLSVSALDEFVFDSRKKHFSRCLYVYHI